MRRLITLLVAAAITMTLLIMKANAQGRGNGQGNGHKHEWKNDRGHSGHKNHYNYDRHDHDNHYESYYSDNHYVYHAPIYAHYHSQHCGHQVVVTHYEKPRYVYYQAYGVYYDHRRNVFISYTGRNWTISTSIPSPLLHVDLRTAVCHEVNYYDDDFVTYLDYGRPMHRRAAYAQR
jgi:hypothetical protein